MPADPKRPEYGPVSTGHTSTMDVGDDDQSIDDDRTDIGDQRHRQ